MSAGLVVVTGAGGFIGRALIAHFRETGRPFRAVVRAWAAERAAPDSVSVVRDLATAADAELDALVDGAAAVVHLAGRAHVMRETGADPRRAYRAANVVATARLARAAVRAGVDALRFREHGQGERRVDACRAGRSVPTIRRRRRTPTREASSTPSASSAASARARRSSPSSCACRSSTAPASPATSSRSRTRSRAGARCRSASIRNRRSVLGIGNLVEAIDAALDAPEAPRGVHFVADAESIGVPDLVRAIAASLGVAARLSRDPGVAAASRRARCPAAARRSTASPSRSRSIPATFSEATGWTPRHSLAHGLAATARWWRLRHAI